ncbi:MAG: hypothetical protein ACTTJS_07705 [Wolinella sp.]
MKKNIELDDELISEEMALELSDMLSVALHFAGVKSDKLEQAMDAYLAALDDFDDNEEYGREAMISIIENLKKHKKELFK